MERIHLKHKGLKNMQVCEFAVGEGPLKGKKVTQGEWHFLALTVSPRVGGGYQVVLQVDGVTHFTGGDDVSSFTIMGVDFWRTPDCIQVPSSAQL